MDLKILSKNDAFSSLYSVSDMVIVPSLGTEGQGLPQYPDRKHYALTQLAIPFGGGFKYAFTDNFMIGAEISCKNVFQK